MLFANFVNVFLHRVPRLLTHNYGDVLRPFDFPAPVFQFLIGVSLALFLEKHARLGRTARGAKVAALRRFALLVLLGMLLDCVGALHVGLRWGVLQTLGLGGMIATLLADAPAEGVAGVAIALLGCFSGALNGEVHANPIAALAFVPLTLGGLLLGRLLPRGERQGLGRFIGYTALLALGAGALAAAFYGGGIPFNKVLGTSSFVALASGRMPSAGRPRCRARSLIAFQASFDGSACAFSHRLTVDTVTAISWANSSCVMPSCWRRVRIKLRVLSAMPAS